MSLQTNECQLMPTPHGLRAQLVNPGFVTHSTRERSVGGEWQMYFNPTLN